MITIQESIPAKVALAMHLVALATEARYELASLDEAAPYMWAEGGPAEYEHLVAACTRQAERLETLADVLANGTPAELEALTAKAKATAEEARLLAAWAAP